MTKAKLRNRILALAASLMRKNREAPKYSIDLLTNRCNSDTRGIQLGSYLHYATRVERKL